jgi:predicted secreted protein
MRLFYTAMLTAMVFTSLSAMADDRADIGLPPQGHTLVNLSASESKTLKQDLLVASLRIEEKGKESLPIQKKINEAMAKAVAIAKKFDTLKVETGSYSLYEYHEPIVDEKDGKVVRHDKQWRGSQTITIRSIDSENVLKAVGEIQALGLVMSNLQYTLSPETEEKEKDAMLVAALKKLQDKAATVSKALGKSGYELADVNVDQGMSGPPVMYGRAAKMEMAMAADAGMPAPVAEAGESIVTLNVSARVLLTP